MNIHLAPLIFELICPPYVGNRLACDPFFEVAPFPHPLCQFFKRNGSLKLKNEKPALWAGFAIRSPATCPPAEEQSNH